MSENPDQPSAEAERLLALRLSGLRGRQPASLPGASGGPVPLSFEQRRLWFIDQADPGIRAYNVHAAYRLRGHLDVDALRAALRFVMRHEALLAIVVMDSGEPRQITSEPPRDVLQVRDFSGQPDPLTAAREFIWSCVNRRFVLAEGPLFRAGLASLGSDDHVLVMVVHHIIFDRESLSVWEAEVSEAFAAFSDGRQPALAPLTAQYRDYVRWQREQAARDDGQRHLGYWRQHLRGAPVTVDLPSDRPRPKQPSYRACSVQVELAPERAAGLAALARQQRTTLFTVALAALQGLLFRYSPAADLVVIGCPVNGRARAEFEGLIGFFTRSLPIAASRPAADAPFRAMTAQARDSLLAAHAHQEAPFDEIVRLAMPPRDLGYNPLFQIWFDLVASSPAGHQGLSLPGLEVTEFDTELIRIRFDLEFHLAEQPTGALVVHLIFAADMFERATAETLARHYGNFLSAVARDPDIRLPEIPILAADEHDTIVNKWSVAR